MFSEGEYVVYSAGEICRLGGREKRSFDGVHVSDYIRLIPQSSEHSVYYVPADTLEKKVRRLLSREDIYSIIDRLPRIQETWDADSNRRKMIFEDLIKSHDYNKLFCVVKSVHSEQKKKTAGGKKLSAADERAMKTAENIISREFSFVLGIKPEEVNDFIAKRLEKCAES